MNLKRVEYKSMIIAEFEVHCNDRPQYLVLDSNGSLTRGHIRFRTMGYGEYVFNPFPGSEFNIEELKDITKFMQEEILDDLPF